MTDQPKPTPIARPQCTEMHIDLLITTCERLTANNQQLQQRVDELERYELMYKISDEQNDGLAKDIDELRADLRTASDQVEALSKDNQRLRELLRRVVITAERDDFGSVGVELLEQIQHAIGRTGE